MQHCKLVQVPIQGERTDSILGHFTGRLPRKESDDSKRSAGSRKSLRPVLDSVGAARYFFRLKMPTWMDPHTHSALDACWFLLPVPVFLDKPVQCDVLRSFSQCSRGVLCAFSTLHKWFSAFLSFFLFFDTNEWFSAFRTRTNKLAWAPEFVAPRASY
jgi:hypothetical protein